MNSYIRSETAEVVDITRAILDHGILTKVSEINITSGTLIVGDFNHGLTQNNELLEKFPIGKFPVYYFRYFHAGTLIVFDKSLTPTKWKIAKYFTSSTKPLTTFDVESGDFVYVDKDGLNAISNNEKNKVYPNNFKDDEIYQRFQANINTLHFDIPIINSQNNLILMHTEYGDDTYKSYIAYNAKRIPVCLYTSLGISRY